MNGSETDEVIEELFKSLRQRYQKKECINKLEELIRGSDFMFDSVDACIMILIK